MPPDMNRDRLLARASRRTMPVELLELRQLMSAPELNPAFGTAGA